MLDALRRTFADPPREFGPIPFWFWNDELSAEEIVRQLRDFHDKEVGGFVIHPRMGLPRTIPYMSDAYLELAEIAVAEAERLGLAVILYDEGMYPSGSACGAVVRQNPAFACRALRLAEIPCGNGPATVVPELGPGEELVSVQAVRRLAGGKIAPESTALLECRRDRIAFKPPVEGEWVILLFVETASRGTIRGVHPGQDDGEPDAPPAADLLNPDAVRAFLSLTHEVYYRKLARHFGTTVIAMFTDEPDLLGRRHAEGLRPWTRGFLRDFAACGGRERDLPALWLDIGEETMGVRERFEAAVMDRLERTYYRPLAAWCEEHGLALTGHPAGSGDIGPLKHFHIPGQDIVWRFVAPEAGKAVEGPHSVLGKCASDAARHRGRRRNLNEVFGVCGKESGWALRADEMKWYLDWLFVRGCNMIVPHAFYYSIRGERRNERPPDVGPHNIWWDDYRAFARYIRRMSWLQTDGANDAQVAVLCGAAHLPWRIAKPLYEAQIAFNYLEEELLAEACEIRDGAISIAKQRYGAVLIEDGGRVGAIGRERLRAFAGQGGIVIEAAADGAGPSEDGWHAVNRMERIPPLLAGLLPLDPVLEPACAAVRIDRVRKEGVWFFVIVNEGEAEYEGVLKTRLSGKTEIWRPWTGEAEEAETSDAGDGNGMAVAIRLRRRECLLAAIEPGERPVPRRRAPLRLAKRVAIAQGWRAEGGDENGRISGELAALASWTEREGMGRYSGTIVYENTFVLADPERHAGITLDLGEAHESARVWVNGREAGVRMWKPYAFDIGPLVREGKNRLRVAVTNSLANRYDGIPLPSGLLGPVELVYWAREEVDE